MLPLIICIVVWGIWGFAEKQAITYMTPVSAMVVANIVWGLVGLLLLISQPVHLTVKGVSWSAISVLCTALATFIFLKQMQVQEASTVIAVTSAYPLVTMMLCVIFLHEKVTLYKVLGTIAIILGVTLLGL